MFLSNVFSFSGELGDLFLYLSLLSLTNIVERHGEQKLFLPLGCRCFFRTRRPCVLSLRRCLFLSTGACRETERIVPRSPGAQETTGKYYREKSRITRATEEYRV